MLKSFLFIPLFLINQIFSWTDFSETVINYNGIYDLYGLKAYCPQKSILRGIALEKPTKSTIRWAMNCIPFESTNDYISQSITTQVNCSTNSLSWLSNFNLYCGSERVIIGLSLEHYYNGLCGIHYLCRKIDGALCYKNNYIKTISLPLPEDNSGYFPILPVVAWEYSAGLNWFQMKINNINNTFYYNYGWCILPEYTSESNIKSIIDDVVYVDYFFKLSEEKSIKFLVYELYEIINAFNGTVVFNPHYIVDIGIKNKKDKCVGNYCLDSSMRVRESIKQKCIFENQREIFFEYLKEYIENCTMMPLYYRECGKELFLKNDVRLVDIFKCSENSLDIMFDTEIKLLKESKVDLNKSILINWNKSIEGKREKLIEELCVLKDSLLCYKERKNIFDFLSIYIKIICIFIPIILILIYLYKKTFRQ